MSVAYRLNHWYSIYGFDQGLELFARGAIKFIEQFSIFFFIEFCAKSALERCKCYSTIQICLQFESRKVPTEVSRREHISLSERIFV